MDSSDITWPVSRYRVPVGGWTQLTLRQDGSWNFSGHLRDSGLPSYDDSVVWAVKNTGTDEIYLFPHTGRTHGTLEAGSRDDDWDDSGTNAALASGWASLFTGGYHWSCRAGVNIDAGSIIDAAEKAAGVAATVIAFLLELETRVAIETPAEPQLEEPKKIRSRGAGTPPRGWCAPARR